MKIQEFNRHKFNYMSLNLSLNSPEHLNVTILLFFNIIASPVAGFLIGVGKSTVGTWVTLFLVKIVGDDK